MNYKAVYKYSIPTNTGVSVHKMPKDAEILCVQLQAGLPQIWALVNPDAEKEERKIAVVGTGFNHEFLSKSSYVGTFQEAEGALIWHVFELL